MNILIFKTNIRYKKDLRQVYPVLNSLSAIAAWHIDREDIDKVLRVEAKGDHTQTIISQVQRAGFRCEELV
jgi:hypothetical protein